MRKAAMSLPPSDFGSHRAIQAVARAADDLIAPYRARIAALEARLALKSGDKREQVMLDVIAKNVENMNEAVRIGNERQARIEALEAELAAAKTVNREVLSRENDKLRAINDKLRDDVVALKARIEALEYHTDELEDALNARTTELYPDLRARIEALEAAGKGLAEAVTLMEACRADDGPDSGWWSEDSILAMDKAVESLAAWRMVDKGGEDE